MKKARINILGIDIDPLTMQETVNSVERYVLEKKALHLMGVNADKINQCHDDEEIRKIVNESGIINADGASVVLASKFLGSPIPERVAGIDLMQELLHLAIEMVIFLLKRKKLFKKIFEKKIQILSLSALLLLKRST